MSRLVGKELTKLLLDRLSGQDVTPHESKIIPIFTLDDLGWPHPALLSYYEVVAKNSSTVDLALWKNRSTANNLRRLCTRTLMLKHNGINHYLKDTSKELAPATAWTQQGSPLRSDT